MEKSNSFRGAAVHSSREEAREWGRDHFTEDFICHLEEFNLIEDEPS